MSSSASMDQPDQLTDSDTETGSETGSDTGVAVARRNTLIVSITAALGGLLYGYDTGVISGALLQIKDEWHLERPLSFLPGWFLNLFPGGGADMRSEFVTTAILVGAVIGALVSGQLSKRLGRRPTVIAIAAVFAIGVIACALSVNEWMLMGCRLFLGMAVGGASQVIPTYIAELAPPERRGRLVTFFNIAIGVGIFLANVVGVGTHELSVRSGGDFHFDWRWMVGLAVIPALVLLIGMLALPETPRWLIDHGHSGRARRVLNWVRPSQRAARREAKQIRRVAERERREGSNPWRNLREPWVRPALLAALGVAAFTQLSGLEMMIYYAPTILTDSGFSAQLALWTSVGVATIYLVMTIIGKLIVDHLGRRRLMLIMIPGAIVSLLAFGALFFFYDGTPPAVPTVILLLLYMAFNAGGIQVVGWLLGSEMYPLSIRDVATSLHAVALWGSNILVTFTALTSVSLIGMHGTMWVYAGWNILALIFVWAFVPETKGHALEEIEESLQEGTFNPHKGENVGTIG